MYVAVFSIAEESVPPGAPKTTLRDEFLASMQTFGIPTERTPVFSYPVRNFPSHRQDILDEMLQMRRSIAPTMVMLPSSDDIHQDHQVVHNEGMRCFKDLSVWGYELPWNSMALNSQAFVRLEPCHLQAKLLALQQYRTQFELGRPYFQREFVEGLAHVRGAQIKVLLAEAFQVLRLRW